VKEIKHVYEVRPRKDKRGYDLISDALPFGGLWYGFSTLALESFFIAGYFRTHTTTQSRARLIAAHFAALALHKPSPIRQSKTLREFNRVMTHGHMVIRTRQQPDSPRERLRAQIIIAIFC
jgi:hypothetical protein